MALCAGAGQANGAHVSGTFVTGEVVAQGKPNSKANRDKAASSSDVGKENLKVVRPIVAQYQYFSPRLNV